MPGHCWPCTQLGDEILKAIRTAYLDPG